MRAKSEEITSFFVQRSKHGHNALRNAAGFVLLKLFPLLLVGCGLTINTPGNQSTGTSSDGWGGPGGERGPDNSHSCNNPAIYRVQQSQYGSLQWRLGRGVESGLPKSLECPGRTPSLHLKSHLLDVPRD